MMKRREPITYDKHNRIYNLVDVVKNFIKSNSNPLIVVLGPTASGKTSFSIELAGFIQLKCGRKAEIVNADSRQLYKYLNIGTAKITKEGMEGIPHHLIDILDPKEEASAGWYQNKARNVISRIQERGNVPLLVGGSMLYLSVITDALTLAPTPTAKLRESILGEYEKDCGESLYKKLQEIDPETADCVHPKNKPRLVRAIEIYELTRKLKSKAVPKTELRPRENSQKDMLIFGMQWPRGALSSRIDVRTREMFQMGWVEEVRELLDRGYVPEDPGMKSHGYREIMEALAAGQPIVEELLVEVIAAKSRRYAKRQIAWWRGDRRIKWVG